MKAVVLLAFVLALATPAAPQIPSSMRPEKPQPGAPAPQGVVQGGDTIETPVPIEGLPYFTTGTTERFNDDYDDPGHYYFVISIDGWLGVPCDSAYVARIWDHHYNPNPVEKMSWGTIKATYR